MKKKTFATRLAIHLAAMIVSIPTLIMIGWVTHYVFDSGKIALYAVFIYAMISNELVSLRERIEDESE